MVINYIYLPFTYLLKPISVVWETDEVKCVMNTLKNQLKMKDFLWSHLGEECGSMMNWKIKRYDWAIELKVNVCGDVVFFSAVADWWQF